MSGVKHIPMKAPFVLFPPRAEHLLYASQSKWGRRVHLLPRLEALSGPGVRKSHIYVHGQHPDAYQTQLAGPYVEELREFIQVVASHEPTDTGVPGRCRMSTSRAAAPLHGADLHHAQGAAGISYPVLPE